MLFNIPVAKTVAIPYNIFEHLVKWANRGFFRNKKSGKNSVRTRMHSRRIHTDRGSGHFVGRGGGGVYSDISLQADTLLGRHLLGRHPLQADTPRQTPPWVDTCLWTNIPSGQPPPQLCTTPPSTPHPLPSGQTYACENITFPATQSIKMPITHLFEYCAA